MTIWPCLRRFVGRLVTSSLALLGTGVECFGLLRLTTTAGGFGVNALSPWLRGAHYLRTAELHLVRWLPAGPHRCGAGRKRLPWAVSGHIFGGRQMSGNQQREWSDGDLNLTGAICSPTQRVFERGHARVDRMRVWGSKHRPAQRLGTSLANPRRGAVGPRGTSARPGSSAQLGSAHGCL